MPSHSNGFPSIGIVGVGVVGGAVRYYFESNGIRPRLFDPYKRLGSLAEVDQADLVFVCVPTPYRAGVGFDDSALDATLAAFSGTKTVVIKSTVLPGTTAKYHHRYPQHTVLFNPEFLREKTAVEDFLHPDRQIVGYCGGNREAAELLQQLLPRAPYEAVVPAAAAELTKYATNAFLALKVIFANELFDLCEALGIRYSDVRDGLATDARIGDSHLDVFDGGYRGYGGKCLPKDTMALLDLAAELDVSLTVVEAAHEANRRLRPPLVLDHGASAATPGKESAAVDSFPAKIA